MSLLTLTDQNFEQEIVKSKELALVDFWAPWCGPCRVMSPIVDKLAEEYNDKAIKIGKMNVDENSIVSSKYGVMSIPTLIFFRNGKPTEQLVGVQKEEELKKIIRTLLK